jgi:DNA (cytosine-5)-methyltransferase 1
MGYYRAGFDVTGVDIKPQPRYPFEFIQMDAIQALEHANCLSGYTAIHASPPCQDYSKAMRHLSGDYPRLIEPVRNRLEVAGVPWVIENVEGAPLPAQDTLDGAHGVLLCGTMFRLPFWWHRLFETSFPLPAPRGCDHTRQPMNPNRRNRPGGRTSSAEWSRARGTDLMKRNEAREAIPPAYTEYIGHALLDHLRERAA